MGAFSQVALGTGGLSGGDAVGAVLAPPPRGLARFAAIRVFWHCQICG